VGILVLVWLVQEKVYIDRLDKEKPAYMDAIQLYDQAAAVADSNPPKALKILGELHEKLDSPGRPGLKNYERLLSIEIEANTRETHSFLPFQLRGLVRMKMAEQAASPEEKRKWWSEAAADLKKSVERGTTASKDSLEIALRELSRLPPPAPVAAEKTGAQIKEEWSKGWSRLAEELGPDRFRAEDGALVERASALLRRMATEAAPKDATQAKAWLAQEVEKLQLRLPSQSREDAKGTLSWSIALSRALEGIELPDGTRESLRRLRAEAAKRAEFRGSFSLKIGPSPFAEGIRLFREGAEIPLRIRATPLLLTDLEIGDYTLEMSHPKTGPRTWTIRAQELKAGRTFVLSGPMKEGKFTLSESP
jgi:hypothetical protein